MKWYTIFILDEDWHCVFDGRASLRAICECARRLREKHGKVQVFNGKSVGRLVAI